MKIAITGHSAGIGQAFAKYLVSRGHTIVGLSKREGNNIRNISKIVEKIVDCDMFINNAQAGFAQTELFLKVSEQWANSRDKMIWNISTIMTQQTILPNVPGVGSTALLEYRTQKRSLEDAANTVRETAKCRVINIRPGSVATELHKTPGVDSADVDNWVKTLCNFYITCRDNNLFPEDISLGFKKQALKI